MNKAKKFIEAKKIEEAGDYAELVGKAAYEFFNKMRGKSISIKVVPAVKTVQLEGDGFAIIVDSNGRMSLETEE